MNYAVEGLQLLKDNGIPVVAIEGNHDQKHTDSEFSWLRSLADWGLVHLLEPLSENGRFVLNEWDAETHRAALSISAGPEFLVRTGTEPPRIGRYPCL
jgi:DNA repair exonuclease SbcCD nuclease subunit